MPTYTPPLRDMQFVMHELLNVTDDLKTIPRHADIDVDTINAILEEGGKFASEVIFPLNISGDTEGCTHDKVTHAVKTPKGFKEAYGKYIEGGWAALSCDGSTSTWVNLVETVSICMWRISSPSRMNMMSESMNSISST